MTPTTRLRIRRSCLFLALGLAAWVGIAFYTGGLTIWLGSFRLLSARGLRNPTILAFVVAGAWWLVARGGISAALRADFTWAARTVAWLRLPRGVALAATAAAVAIGATEGVFIVGGADSYGYVSEAHLWAQGRMRVPEPMIATLGDLAPLDASMPLGYRPAPGGQHSVPTYSPGYPMLMALFEWVGGRDAVFAVVPVLAGLLVWATFLLGRRVAGPAVGAAAAVLVTVSPTVLLHTVSPPMSDVPTAAWWTLALALMGSGTRAAVAGAGLAAGAAVLTRPNLAPLAVIPAAVIAWPFITQRRFDRALLGRLVMYSAPVAVSAAVVGAINWSLNGSPLLSGYGSLDQYYDWSNWAHNLDRYPRWLLQTQTPWILLALAAPFVLRRPGAVTDNHHTPSVVIGALMLFVAGVLLSYVFYLRFDAWIYLRFLLPVFPILLIFVCSVILSLTRRLPRGWAGVAFVLAIALLAFNGYTQARTRGVFLTGSERKYAIIGRYVDGRLPPNAAVFTMQHGGNVRYYAGRAIVRWDYVDPAKLDAILVRVRDAGYEPYLLLEAWEVPHFRQRFDTHRIMEVLNRPAIAQLPLGDIRLYSLAPAGGPPRVTETIPDP